MPAGAVYVGRPSFWGNPFVEATLPDGRRRVFLMSGPTPLLIFDDAPFGAAEYFRRFVEGRLPEIRGMIRVTDHALEIRKRLHELEGRDVVCWCPLDRACHGDVLIELANKKTQEGRNHASERNSTV